MVIVRHGLFLCNVRSIRHTKAMSNDTRKRKSTESDQVSTSPQPKKPATKEENFTDWAKQTIEQELRSKDPYTTSFIYISLLERLQSFIAKGGEFRSGHGAYIPVPRAEKLHVDWCFEALESLGFQIKYIKLAEDKYQYFVTKNKIN